MSTYRQTSIPSDDARAELAVFPLTSPAAFRLAIVELNPGVGEDDKISKLWRAAEDTILPRLPGHSIDELVVLRDRLWFRSSRLNQTNLGDYLRDLARSHLVVHGDEAIPALTHPGQQLSRRRPTPPDVQARKAWRWLSFAIPEDLLLAGWGVGPDMPSRVNPMSPIIARLLADKGFAETHLHLGAAFDFGVFWVTTLHALADRNVDSNAFAGPGAEFDDGRDMAAWILRAAIARYVLGSFLWHRVSDDSIGDFSSYVAHLTRRATHRSDATAGVDERDGRLRESLSSDLVRVLARSLEDLTRGHFVSESPAFPEVQLLFARLTSIHCQPLPSDDAKIWRVDPLHAFFPTHRGGRTSPEMRFVDASMSYLDNAAAADDDASVADELFAVVFWQAVRIRNIFFRHVVQRPRTPGLQWFVRTFGRLSAGKRSMSAGLQCRLAARVSGLGAGLRSLEVRTAPWADRGELLAFIKEANDTFRSLHDHNSELECGLVFHFIKDRGGQTLDGLPRPFWRESHADVGRSRGPQTFRYESYFKTRCQEANILSWIVRTYPLSLRVIRGFDVCTDELGVPNWVLAPVLRSVHEAAGKAVRWAARHRPEARLRTPGTTVHSGEDFVHLLGGLRRVDESMMYFRLREGDRIGHGLALGVEPRGWAASIGRLEVAKEERLWDLVWERSWYARQRTATRGDRTVFLDTEIARLAVYVLGQELSSQQLMDLRQDLYDESALQAVGFPISELDTASADGFSFEAMVTGQETSCRDTRTAGLYRAPMARERLLRLHRYLTDSSILRHGQETELIDPEQESDILVAVQKSLREKVASRGITVEVNPSSNLLIGNLADLENHPLWRLMPVYPKEGEPSIPVCIGSDDPVTFAATLPSEYMLLHDSLVDAGVPSDVARGWLEAARERGMAARFTYGEPRPSSELFVPAAPPIEGS